MPKLARKVQKVFGDTIGATGQFGIYGSLAAASPQYSKDPKVIQSLAAWELGLAGAVVGNKSPALEDINSLFYTAFYQLTCLLQSGIAEWDADTPYFVDGLCRIGSTVYLSKTDDNLGNDPTTDTNSWRNQASAALEFRYPVGEVFITNRAGDPSALLGFGTWELIAQGQMPVGFKSTDADFDTIGKTGGEKTHTLTVPEMPSHTHPYNRAPARIGTAGANPLWANDETANTGATGGDQPHNNMPPFRVFAFWLRTA